MKFIEFINESRFSISKLSIDVEEDLYIKDGNIYAKRNDQLVIANYSSYQEQDLIQRVTDFVDKHFDNEVDFTNRIEFLTYTSQRDSEFDQYSQDRSRIYQEKPLIGFISNEFENHGYIVGYHGKSLQDTLDYIGLPKAGYDVYIFDGRFKGTKIKLKNGIYCYIIDPSYPIKISDGCTELNFGDDLKKVYHVRRKIT